MSSIETTDLYDHFYTKDHPELGTGPVSVEPYVSAEYFEIEREKIFQNAWMMVCHEGEIPNPGDYIVKKIAVIKTSIIIVRGRDGVVRGFHNTCCHRGNQIFYGDERGCTDAFVCKFHGWSYNLEGNLRGVPERERFFDLDRDKLGLTPVGVEVWKGFVFFHPKAEPAETLVEYLGTLGQSLDAYPFEKLHLAADWSCDVNVNWKVFVDAFQEGYHVAFIHKNVAPSLFNGDNNPYCRLTSYKLHGKHRSMTTPKNSEFVPSATEALAFQFSNTLSQKTEASLGQELWPGLNPGGNPDFGFDINVIFPINFIDISQGWCFTYEFWPLAVDKTHWVARFYATEPQSCSQRIGQELSIVQLREALLEDLNTVEAVQRGLTSGAIKELQFSDQELALRHQHHVVESIVRG